MKLITLLIVVLGTVLTAHAQGPVPEKVYYFSDTVAQADFRRIPSEIIEEYRNDSDFDYRYGYEQSISLWDRFWQWVALQLSKLFGEVEIDFPIDWLLYLFCAAAIIFVILKLTGVSVSGLFKNNEKYTNAEMQEVMEQNIHTINFEEEISRARQASDYRKAVRLLYIYTLKKLAGQQVIQWHPGKTNADYQRELMSHPTASDFRSLSIYYEYAWYGEFPVGQRHYEEADALFHSLDHQLAEKV